MRYILILTILFSASNMFAQGWDDLKCKDGVCSAPYKQSVYTCTKEEDRTICCPDNFKKDSRFCTILDQAMVEGILKLEKDKR